MVRHCSQLKEVHDKEVCINYAFMRPRHSETPLNSRRAMQDDDHTNLYPQYLTDSSANKDLKTPHIHSEKQNTLCIILENIALINGQ
jgi:hypothetical protein